MPASAAAARPEVIPGMMRKRRPAVVRAEASSQPRPNTKGSPPFNRRTRRPSRARSISTSLMSRCCGEGRPPRLPAEMSSAPARASFSTRASTSASCTMSSADATACNASTVKSRGSPGPAPASQTSPGGKSGKGGKKSGSRSMSSEQEANGDIPAGPLRRGWTTGACATAATHAAYEALVTGSCPDPVEIELPSGARAAFAIATFEHNAERATAGVVKDAGDDPDVTHGALVKATVRRGPPGSGISFRAGEGVGTVTKPGLPLPPGEPAINPVPREMMRRAISHVARQFGTPADAVVEISIPGGEALAAKTLNGRLGIVGGLSILGTTGIVVPYSCAAWIHSIHRGIDVARAGGLDHVAGATGSTSENAVRQLYGLPDSALIDMGDFVGGMLKYL